MARKKFKEGTADAFRYKKQLSKLTFDDANAMMAELDKVYTSYRERYDNASSKDEKDEIESEYLAAVSDDLKRIKEVAGKYWELIPGLRDIIDDVYFNMKYTQMLDKRETMPGRISRKKK